MSEFEHEDELLELLAFVNIITIKDINDYWDLKGRIHLEDFTELESVEILSDSDQIKISSEKICVNYEVLRRIRGYILFLLRNDRMTRDVAEKVASVKDFYLLFNAQDNLEILYRAERYVDCITYHENNISAFVGVAKPQSFYQQSLSKVGNYVEDFSDESFETALYVMRFLWQKGDFRSAQSISDQIECRIHELNASQKCYYLNNKIRILRDIGRIRETGELLTQFYTLLETVANEAPDKYKDLKGKYLYNCSINYYIAGDFAKCIAYCEQSMPLRSDQYPDPYIKLREARCWIFQGNVKEYQSLMSKICISPSDNWAHSLFFTVKSEYYRFLGYNLGAAKRFLTKSNKIETAKGAKTVYTDIALLYLYIQWGKKAEINRYLSTVKQYKNYIDGKLAALTGQIALNIIKGVKVTQQIARLCRDFKDYPIYLFISLFSLSKLLERKDLEFPIPVEKLPFGSSFSKELLSTFSYRPRVLIIYSWWDINENEDKENQEWIHNLNITLREHGINSTIDQMCSIDVTIDSKELIEFGAYDSYVVVLTAGFKKRIEQKEGVLYVEYKELLRILEHAPNKIIFARRSDNDAVSPAGFTYQSKLDLSLAKAKNKTDSRILGLVRRIRGIPYYDKTVPPFNEDIDAEEPSYR